MGGGLGEEFFGDVVFDDRGAGGAEVGGEPSEGDAVEES